MISTSFFLQVVAVVALLTPFGHLDAFYVHGRNRQPLYVVDQDQLAMSPAAMGGAQFNNVMMLSPDEADDIESLRREFIVRLHAFTISECRRCFYGVCDIFSVFIRLLHNFNHFLFR